MPDNFEIIHGSDIDRALAKKYRQYLTGHLQLPQIHLPHVDDDIEIGISRYQEFTADTPHMHPTATEHSYILQGSLKVLLLENEPLEYQFNAGDFFVLRPGIGYATKNAPGTTVLFIKSPGVNDKTEIPLTDELSHWLSSWD